MTLFRLVHSFRISCCHHLQDSPKRYLRPEVSEDVQFYRGYAGVYGTCLYSNAVDTLLSGHAVKYAAALPHVEPDKQRSFAWFQSDKTVHNPGEPSRCVWNVCFTLCLIVSTPIRFFLFSVSVLFSYNSEMHVVLICSKRTMWRVLVHTYLDVLCYFMENFICSVETRSAIPCKLFVRW